MDAAPEEGKGDISKRLFKERRWPSTYSAEPYNQYYNAVLSSSLTPTNLLDGPRQVKVSSRSGYLLSREQSG